ncbi:MAG TPA: hypothetical protein VLZ54_13660 [Arenibacter sp.]|nr:hypothetical protein [Arenibacter sp.]
MILNEISDLKENRTPLQLVDIPFPKPKKNEILIKISVCRIGHTELDEIKGRLAPPKLPLVLRHT